ncbi:MULTISPECIES: hypothetical protein [Photorhabdus]|uniref:PAS fold-4 domain-containing protein n=2 Tax=Photorhabdus TaxID=29487 RepID=A0AAW6BM70_9GAMM|nr:MULTISPECIES: hypothetical protein [Photorhabdus]EYU16586.1 hypothetical protein BA1DRAFT_00870 [Photorhabdus aegyptia]MDB6373886.1 hypothetical protein [Photorhabdus bodei]
MAEYNTLSRYSLTINSFFPTQLAETVKSSDISCIVADNKFHYLLTNKAISYYYKRNARLKGVTHGNKYQHANSETMFFLPY